MLNCSTLLFVHAYANRFCKKNKNKNKKSKNKTEFLIYFEYTFETKTHQKLCLPPPSTIFNYIFDWTSKPKFILERGVGDVCQV